MVALLTLLAEAVRVQSPVCGHGSRLCQIVPVLSNPSWLFVVGVSVALVWVLQIWIAWQVVQQVVLCLLFCSGCSLLCIFLGRNLWMK